MVQSRAIQSMLIVTISMFALTIAAVGQALGESSLDTSYIISFARVPVGEITASLVLGNTEYKISARGRAGGMVKVLLDGEGSFTTQRHKYGRASRAENFTSKIVSNEGTSEVTMAFDEDSVKELVAAPLPSSDRVPVTEPNRQAIFDPLTAMLFSASAAKALCPRRRAGAHCRFSTAISATISSSHSSAWTRRQLKKDTPARWWCAPFATNQLPATARRTLLSNTFPKVAKWNWRSHLLPARAGWHQFGSRSQAQSRTW